MRALQDRIKKFSEERGWLKDVKPIHYATSIVIEAAELLEEFQWKHPSARGVMTDPQTIRAVRRELADVVIYCINLANLLQLDLDEVIYEKLQYNAAKYPIDVLKEDPSMYYQIKRQYRQLEL